MTILRKTLVAATLATSLFAGTYSVDASHSNVGFKVKHMMISNVSGNFGEFSGSFEYDEKRSKLEAINGVINVASIDTGIAKRDAHLKSADIFNADKYPEITFKLSEIKGDTAYGKLTMHGITKNVKLDYEEGGSIRDPWGNQRVGFALSGKINRKDFGIKWNQILESGGVAVGETVKLDIEIEGILNK